MGWDQAPFRGKQYGVARRRVRRIRGGSRPRQTRLRCGATGVVCFRPVARRRAAVGLRARRCGRRMRVSPGRGRRRYGRPIRSLDYPVAARGSPSRWEVTDGIRGARGRRLGSAARSSAPPRWNLPGVVAACGGLSRRGRRSSIVAGETPAPLGPPASGEVRGFQSQASRSVIAGGQLAGARVGLRRELGLDEDQGQVVTTGLGLEGPLEAEGGLLHLPRVPAVRGIRRHRHRPARSKTVARRSWKRRSKGVSVFISAGLFRWRECQRRAARTVANLETCCRSCRSWDRLASDALERGLTFAGPARPCGAHRGQRGLRDRMPPRCETFHFSSPAPHLKDEQIDEGAARRPCQEPLRPFSLRGTLQPLVMQPR